MQTQQQQIEDVLTCFHSTDINSCIAILQDSGFKLEHKPMRGIGKGNIKRLKNGTVYVQIGPNHGEFDYALSVVIEPTHQLKLF